LKRVLILSSEFPPGPGGIGTHAHQLAAGLAGLGWEPVVLTSQDYMTDSEIARFNAAQPFPVVRFRRLPFAPAEAFYRGAVLSRWIRRSAPNVVIASGSRSVWLAASRLRGGARPWLAVGHGTEFGAGGWEAHVMRWAFGQATEVVCVSEFTRAWMRRSGVSPRQESVIHNGADEQRFRRLAPGEAKAIRAELGIPSGRILVTVGNVTERKGQDIVVRAMRRILAESPNTHYLVVGLPSRGEELQALARQLGVADHVHLLGRVEPERLVR
jgi:phosphatidyl-myo-inositol dimannoside synthase